MIVVNNFDNTRAYCRECIRDSTVLVIGSNGNGCGECAVVPEDVCVVSSTAVGTSVSLDGLSRKILEGDGLPDNAIGGLKGDRVGIRGVV